MRMLAKYLGFLCLQLIGGNIERVINLAIFINIVHKKMIN